MINSINNFVQKNSNFLPAPQPVQGQSFRDVLSGFQQGSTTHTVSQSGTKSNVLDAISQVRVTAAPAFLSVPTAAVREPVDIRSFYTMPPEDVEPLARQLREELNNTDFFGKTGVEIYEYIENRYIETFGADFMMGHSLLGVLHNTGADLNSPDADKTSNEQYMIIGADFYNSVNFHIRANLGPDTPASEINRIRLYGNMSNWEIMDAIIAKYPQRVTNNCLALIDNDLKSVGLSPLGLGRYVETLILKSDECASNGTMPPWDVLEKRWSNILSRPADVQLLAYLHNDLLIDSSGNLSVLLTKDMLVKLGAELGPNGLFLSPNRNLRVDLHVEPGTIDSDDLTDDFLKTLERHDNSLRDSSERTDRNRALREDAKGLSTRAEAVTG